MDVILLENMRNLGALGATVAVSGGFARNYLIPQRIAVPATAENVADFAERRAELERLANEKLSAAQSRADAISGKDVTIPAKAGDEGKLFGSIGTRDVANGITAMGFEVSKSEVRMPHGLIRNVGEYKITLQFHSEVSTEITLNIVPE
ncbi:MAG: 50S ribosomal protein L9 [Gammaproteobacteria bacterium]